MYKYDYEELTKNVDTILNINYIFDKLTSSVAQKEVFKIAKKAYKNMKKNSLFYSDEILVALKKIIKDMQNKIE